MGLIPASNSILTMNSTGIDVFETPRRRESHKCYLFPSSMSFVLVFPLESHKCMVFSCILWSEFFTVSFILCVKTIVSEETVVWFGHFIYFKAWLHYYRHKSAMLFLFLSCLHISCLLLSILFIH